MEGKGGVVTGRRRGLFNTPAFQRPQALPLPPQPQNLKQQRSRREQFSRAPVSALPLAPNHLGKSQAAQGALGVRCRYSGSEGTL